MMRVPRALALVLGCCVGAGAAAQPAVPPFSQMTVGGPIEHWRPMRPAPKAADTRYSLVADGGAPVLRAEADNAMSALTYTVRVDTRRFPLLRWRWKIAAPVAGADMTSKAGDDYAARVYVLFDYPRARLSLSTRLGMAVAESVYRQSIPTAALNYVWDNRQPVGTIRANAYTDRARMLVVRSGSAGQGQWHTETRDLRADFRAAFGEEAPDVVGLALATDTDNTKGRALAWFGDIEFLPASGPSSP
ncbi:DUF3047 domain-containing protein [Massilia sp. H6]|uniref:DUF3047 domain-containing protein n=1 Tax=Massilia sp. H6 TaxID=2970464 RepID=UPI002167E93B|nr:DUF3047 domain-containing protein [Massilia sp. H6]UVW30044.1 DUF3047 domain-containing protein [Massilia sp. H6]